MEWIATLKDWGVPVWILMIIGGVIVTSLLVEAFAKIFGKRWPILSFLFVKPIKYFIAKHKAKKNLMKEKETLLNDMHITLKEVNKKLPNIEDEQKKLKDFVDAIMLHCSEESINKRDKWMLSVNSDIKWAHDRAKVYDASVTELTELAGIVKQQQAALDLNNKMTSELYKQATRTQILDFSHKLVNARKADKPVIFSREEFRKIRKSYAAYEDFLEKYGGTNGEVDDAMNIVRDAEAGKLPNIEFLEDLRN